ncbi:hypothetical protein [Anaeromyxobacter terrae]|uniref:hypothetical protein n=1 Tax=Anaeromyxobacter terrae TaxID=2925406 RepID=UPI001F56A7F3|nr:hypothetical protein [Anaeromyxobacter sp. SG22]
MRASDLRETLESRATWTNNIIRDGFTSRLGILEETITDMHLLEIHQRHRAHVWTRKFTRKEEASLSGADWLWIIGEPGSWFPVAIQAKIINPANGKCRLLNYKGGQQLGTLVRFARTYRFLPRYCVYSTLDGSFAPKSRLMPGLRLPLDQWACTLVAPRAVSTLIQRKMSLQEDILNEGIPWAVPFAGSSSSSSTPPRNESSSAASPLDESLATSIASQMPMLLTPSDRAALAKDPGKKLSRRVRWDDPDPRAALTLEFPRIAAHLLAGYGARRVWGSTRERLPVAGVSVISSEPIAEALRDFDHLPDRRQRLDYLTRRLNRAPLD